MKAIFVTLLTLLSIQSFAAYNGVLLEKIYQTGFVPDDKAFALDCKIYSDKITIKYQKIGLVKTIQLQKQIESDTLALIDQAATGEITSIKAPTDIGYRIYTAIQVLNNDTIKAIDLGSIKDSDVITKNLSPAAATLKTYLDTTCDAALKM